MKTLIITGTRKGIGRYLAEYYLNLNYNIVGCSRSESDLKHQNYTHYCLDISDEKAVIKMVRETKKTFKEIYGLINNAGIASLNHSITTSVETVQNIFNTNLIGTFLFTREVSKVMMRKKFGRIINYTTVAAPLYLAGEAIYAASKAAVENFTITFAKEVGEFGITVNAVGPTPIETDLIKAVPKIKINELINNQAIRRLGTHEDVKNIIDFYLNENSNFITGQILYLGGINR